jgi:SAM-dependent methyltransferase
LLCATALIMSEFLNEGAVSRRYLDGDYASKNPTWDSEDAPWKAKLIADLLNAQQFTPTSVAEIGCGSGAVLAELRGHLPDAALDGFDITPDAARFWPQHAHANVKFTTCDFLESGARCYDLILLLDVLEHVADPHGFLTAIRERAARFIFHFPLDLSAASVLRESPLLESRDRVGHIHYFTKGLVLALLHEGGFDILHWQYTGAAFASPQRTLRTRLAALPRYIAYAMNKDWGVRLLGGETLLVLARPGERAA